MLILSHANHVKNVKESMQTRTPRHTNSKHLDQNISTQSSSLSSRSGSSFNGSDSGRISMNDSGGKNSSGGDPTWEDFHRTNISKDGDGSLFSSFEDHEDEGNDEENERRDAELIQFLTEQGKEAERASYEANERAGEVRIKREPEGNHFRSEPTFRDGADEIYDPEVFSRGSRVKSRPSKRSYNKVDGTTQANKERRSEI